MQSKAIARILQITVISMLIACNVAKEEKTHSAITVNNDALAQRASQQIIISGLVINSDSQPISDVEINFAGEQAATDENGSFEITLSSPKNGLIIAQHAEYYATSFSINMQSSELSETYSVPTITLQQSEDTTVRFVFGGDVSFGRRYLDPEEQTPVDQVPPDIDEALIKPSSALSDTQAIIKWIEPWLSNADWTAINLETPVITSPATPHPEKSFVFFTLPESVLALKAAGVDYVSLGNNHIYDYLDTGVTDTLMNIEAAGLAHSGAGLTVSDAFAAHRVQLAGQQYAFLSANSVSGSQHSIDYIVDETSGGSADLRDDDAIITAIINEITAGQIPIAQWHTGKEYTYTPTDYAAGRIALGTENGAALVVAHHPHIAQGVGYDNGVFSIDGLGNLAFDQDRLDVFLGLLAQVDMSGATVNQITLLPVFIKDYIPSPLTGDLANRFIRRLAKYSLQRGTYVYPDQHQGMVQTVEPERNEQTVQISFTLDDNGQHIVDMRGLASSEASLAMVTTQSEVTLKAGQDSMMFGGFENYATDDTEYDLPMWSTSKDAQFICLTHAMRGLTGLCAIRDSDNETETTSAFLNRIRVLGDSLDTPNKDITIYGYMKGENAGRVQVYTRYFASTGDATFGQETVYQHGGGDFEWEAFYGDINMPADASDGDTTTNSARALKVYMAQLPPESGEALLAFDELAVINWDLEIGAGEAIAVPHPRDFIKVIGTPREEVALELVVVKYD